MLSEIGILCLALALGFGVVQVLASLCSGVKWRELGRYAAFVQGGFVTVAFGTLITAFLVCDFSLSVVAAHDHTALPWFYRLGATWGNYEGSLLLFILVLAGVGSGFALFLLPTFMRARALVAQGILTVGFLTFLLLTSNPFETLPFSVTEGASLNPLLQDRGLLFHPPLLYLGYAGFSALFSLSLAALWGQEKAEEWQRLVRPWALCAWGMLTAGITLGSWWAYYELGWGGWWFWDPVENASLMPWLAGTALLHSLLTPRLYRWSLLLSLLTFGMSLLGTFLTRSGLVTSVHAFAEGGERTHVLLWMVGGIMGASLLVWIWRSSDAVEQCSSKNASTIPLYCYTVFLLTAGLVVILLGTLYPLLSREALSVGPPYFEKTFIPLMVPLLLLMPVGSMLRNKQEPLLPLLILPLTATLVGMVLVLYLLAPTSLLAFTGIGVGLWVLSGTLMAYVKKRLSLGSTLAHLGVAVSLLGVSVGSGFRQDVAQILGVKDNLTIGSTVLSLQKVEWGRMSTYDFERARLTYSGGVLSPEKRLYKPQDMLVAETAIRTNGLRDLYVSVGAYQGNNRWLIHASLIPLAPWIWMGGGLMVLGAIVSLVRRKRQ